MGWQDRFRELGDLLISGEITTDEYRTRSEEILAEADVDAAADTQPTETEAEQDRTRVHIPVSAAWEAPSGEMTQIVGARDETTTVGSDTIGDNLDGATVLTEPPESTAD
ncbi:MAG: hypothetical protein GEV28_13505 [Actinophytocola sp.]|uniref:hypothetical protein n=1 Tax=Actinophytocola sp. TaxID=1872138 RepID=UPI00132CA784|nr:hypothetical protein [Actinophytocola sp.]MPZ81353.1 hypothetical protein [Actinophytocola sp.]